MAFGAWQGVDDDNLHALCAISMGFSGYVRL